MRKSLLTLIGALCMMCAVAQASNPSANVKTRAKGSTTELSSSKLNYTKSAFCEITFDAAGRFKNARMTQSTGAKVLDNAMTSYSRQRFAEGGPPNLRLSLPFMCKSVEAEAPQRKFSVLIAGPSPPYPAAARIRRVQGSGVVEISFDAKGDAVSAVMAESTGSQILDEAAVKHMHSTWKSSGGAKAKTLIPITYRF